MNYSWIAILVNVPATLFATGYYEFLMRDSLSKIGKGHAVHEHGEEGLRRHISRAVSFLPLHLFVLFSRKGGDNILGRFVLISCV